jgi:hypothetical protein
MAGPVSVEDILAKQKAEKEAASKVRRPSHSEALTDIFTAAKVLDES